MRSFIRYWIQREIRSDRIILYGFFLTLGMAALTLVDLFSARILETTARDTRKFMGADFMIRSWREPPESMRAQLESLLGEDADSQVIAQKSLFVSATRASDEVFNLNLSGVESGFPLYGDLIVQTEKGEQERPEIPSGAVFVDQSLKARGVALGESLRIGGKNFQIAGFIKDEPQSTGFLGSLGYRALIRLSDLMNAGLVIPGARVNHRFLIKTQLSEEIFRSGFRREFPDKHWRLISVREGTEQVARVTGILTTILVYFAVLASLMGSLTAYFLFRIRIRKKLPELLTLKCLGVRERSIIAVNLSLFSLLAFIGVLTGFLLGLAVENYLVDLARGLLGTELSETRPWFPTLLRVSCVALLAVFWSTYFPLREVLRVPVNSVFSGNGEVARDSKQNRLFQGIILALLSFAFVFFFSAGLRQSLITYGSLLGSVLLAFVLVEAVMRLLQKFWNPESSLLPFLLSRGLLRHGLRSRIILVSLVIGLVVGGTAFLLSNSLRSQITVARENRTADLVMIVPDEEQRDILNIMEKEEAMSIQWIPYTQARVYRPTGEALRERREEDSRDGARDEPEEDGRVREYFVNYRSETAALVPGEELVLGESLFGKKTESVVRLSMDQRFADRIGMKVNDRLRVEIGGVSVDARIDSLRKINWFNFNPNFFIVVAEEDLEGAPRAWFGLSRIQQGSVEEWQNRVVALSPQSIAFDSRAIADKVLDVLNKVDAAVFWVGVFLMLTLLVLLWGISSGRLLDWPGEKMLFDSLGIRSVIQRRLLVAELLVLWGFALAISIGLSAAGAQFLSIQYFKFPLWWPSVSGLIGAALVVLGLVGLSLLSLRSGLAKSEIR